MSREVIHELLTRYVEGECSPEEKEIVEEWYTTLEDRSPIADIHHLDHQEIEDRLWRTFH